MKSNLNTILLSTLIMSIAAISCSESTPNYLSIGEPEYITELPLIKNIELIDTVDCEVYGMRSVKIVDSLLIIGTNSSWTAISSKDKKPLANFFSIGQGPGEFNSIPRTGEGYFFTKNDSLHVFAQDHNNGRILELNLSKAVANEPFEVKPAYNSPEINNNCWTTIPCGEGKVFLSRANNNFTGFNRYVVELDTIYSLPITQQIDQITIESDGDINLLSKVARFSPQVGKIVEFMIYLNQINVFSIDGNWGKTICVGKKLDNLSKIERQPRFFKTNTYITGSVWPQGFGALYSGYSEIDVQKLLSEHNTIQFFDWEGNGICEVKIPYQALAFDLDFDNKVLYVINQEDDMLLRYDASDVVDMYKNRL